VAGDLAALFLRCSLTEDPVSVPAMLPGRHRPSRRRPEPVGCSDRPVAKMTVDSPTGALGPEFITDWLTRHDHG